MEATLLFKWGQLDEGGEEERIMKRVHGQDPSDCGKTGGDRVKIVNASRRH